MTIKLLPCPLCHSENVGSDWCGDINRIFCYSCGLTLEPAFAPGGETRWNTRKPNGEQWREVKCPTDTEVWLEFGWLKGDNDDHDMLWYNEGRAEEFHHWFRSLMMKKATDMPNGRMYFKMLIRPDCSIEIICEPQEKDGAEVS